MKKLIKLVSLILVCICVSSCSLKINTLDNAVIYTTVNPINYITKVLYGNNAKEITSIYPNDCDYDKYKLNKKQIKTFASGDLFIYNGLTSEKEIAKSLLNKNSDLLIIDVTNGLTIKYDMTELWLSPNNYLMLAKNIKNNLQEYSSSKAFDDEVESNYAAFEEKISVMDANLHLIGKTARNNGTNTIIASNNTFKYLEIYGFVVISLEDEANLKDNKLATIKNNFLNGKYKYILTLDSDLEDELIIDLKENYKAEIVEVDSLTLTLEDDYFDIMNTYIKNIQTITE